MTARRESVFVIAVMGKAPDREAGEWGLMRGQRPKTRIFIPGLMGRLSEKMQVSPSHGPGRHRRSMPDASRKGPSLSWPQFPRVHGGSLFKVSTTSRNLLEHFSGQRASTVSPFTEPDRVPCTQQASNEQFFHHSGLVRIPFHITTVKRSCGMF